MPNIPGSNFVIHATKNDSTHIDYGPFGSMNEALSFANDKVASGDIQAEFTVTYTDQHGNDVQYEQV